MKAKHTFFALSILSTLILGCASSNEDECDPNCGSSGYMCCPSGYVCSANRTCVEQKKNGCVTSNDCTNGTTCYGGKCVCVQTSGSISVCAANETCCASAGCVDTRTDNENCGICGTQCPSHLSCSFGECLSTETCTHGTKKCNYAATGFDVCQNGSWTSSTEKCLDNQKCSHNECIFDSCNEGDMRCRDGNVEFCSEGTYQIYSECTLPKRCDDETLKCKLPAECEDNAVGCTDDGNIKTCIDGNWVQTQKCPIGKTCSAATGECLEAATCTNGDKKCNGTDMKSCAGGHWSDVKCPTGTTCYNGSCVKRTCEEGETVCYEFHEGAATIIQVQRCENNALVMSEQCMSGQICVVDANGKAKCETDTCAQRYRCENNSLIKCEFGKDTIEKNCTSTETCNANTAACEKKCGNGILDEGEQCDSNTLIDSQYTCQNQLDPSFSGTITCTSECKISTTKCIQTCGNGTLDTGEECDGSTFAPKYKTCTEILGDYTGTVSCKKDCTVDTTNCSPKAGSWDHQQTFDDLKTIDTSYTTTNKMNVNGIYWEIIGSTSFSADHYIDSTKAVALTTKKGTTSKIMASSISNGVGQFAFDYRGWGTDTGSITITFTPTSGEAITDTLDFTSDAIKAYTKSINRSNIKSFTIAPVATTSDKNKRIIIDNVRWTNAK